MRGGEGKEALKETITKYTWFGESARKKRDEDEEKEMQSAPEYFQIGDKMIQYISSLLFSFCVFEG